MLHYYILEAKADIPDPEEETLCPVQHLLCSEALVVEPVDPLQLSCNLIKRLFHNQSSYV